MGGGIGGGMGVGMGVVMSEEMGGEMHMGAACARRKDRSERLHRRQNRGASRGKGEGRLGRGSRRKHRQRCGCERTRSPNALPTALKLRQRRLLFHFSPQIAELVIGTADSNFEELRWSFGGWRGGVNARRDSRGRRRRVGIYVRM